MITHSSNMSGGGEDDFRRLMEHFSGRYKLYSVVPSGPMVDKFKSLSYETLVILDRIFPFECLNLKKYIAYVYFSFLKLSKLLPYLISIRNKIDICYVNSSVCVVEILVLSFLKIPFVLSIKEILEPYFIRKLFYKFINRTSSGVIVISGLLKDLYTEINEKSTPYLIRSSIDHEFYTVTKDNLKLTFARTDDNFVIVNIGVITESKNQKLLIKAMANINSGKKSRVFFIGKVVDGKYYKYLQELIRVQNLKDVEFVFTMELPKNKVLEKIYASDCVVITSKKEGMSLVLVESLFMEKPVIATKVGVIPEIIKDGVNGFLINDDDYMSLSEFITVLQQSADVKSITGNLYETYLKNFSIEYFKAKHEEIILENAK